MFATVLIIAYYLVAVFYCSFGILLLTHPHFCEQHLRVCFPLLASYRYQRVVNSLNLISIGLGLIIIGQLLAQDSLAGFFLALVLSGLETYLGIAFYYFEERNLTQAIIHFWLHIILVVALGAFILSSFAPEITLIRTQSASLITSMIPWNL